MSVRQAITDLTSFLQVAPPAWRAPEMATTTMDLSRRAAMVQGPIPETDFDGLYKKFQRAIATNDWTRIDPLDWCDVTYLLWRTQPGLLTINRFQINYRRFLENSKTARPFRRLIYAYLEAYDPVVDGVDWAGGLIRKILAQKRYLILEYWRRIELEFQIFSNSPGPKLFAARCLEHPESVYRLHEDLGLTGALSVGGYARYAYLSAADVIKGSEFRSGSDLIRLQRFIEWTVGSDARRTFLRFPSLQSQTLCALLPTQLPSKQGCELLGRFYIRYAEAWRKGDPSCIEPSSAEIEIMGKILTAATTA